MLNIVNYATSIFQDRDTSPRSITLWLYFKVTVLILIIAAFFIYGNRYISGPISCTVDEERLPFSVLNSVNSYCFMTSTYIQLENQTSESTDDHQPIYYWNYQWFPYFLLFQALVFYLPRLMWIRLEDNLLRIVRYQLQQKSTDVQFLLDSTKRFGIYFLLYECFFYFLPMLQLIMIVFFLKPYNMAYEIDTNLLERLFPLVTMCQYKIYRSAGHYEQLLAQCVLSLNSINRVIFIFLIVWNLFLFIVATCNYTWWLRICCSKHSYRATNIHRISTGLDFHEISSLTHKLKFSQWIVLYILVRKIDIETFNSMIIKKEKTENLDENIPAHDLI